MALLWAVSLVASALVGSILLRPQAASQTPPPSSGYQYSAMTVEPVAVLWGNGTFSVHNATALAFYANRGGGERRESLFSVNITCSGPNDCDGRPVVTYQTTGAMYVIDEEGGPPQYMTGLYYPRNIKPSTSVTLILDVLIGPDDGVYLSIGGAELLIQNSP